MPRNFASYGTRVYGTPGCMERYSELVVQIKSGARCFVWVHQASLLHDIFTSRTSNIMGFLLKPPPDTPGKAWPAIVIGLFVAFGGVLYG
jgi:hypothetical protein